MHLIVDGYNVIRQSPRLQFLDVMDLQAGREALLELLAHYRRRSSTALLKRAGTGIRESWSFIPAGESGPTRSSSGC